MISRVILQVQQIPRGAVRASGDSLVEVRDTLGAAVGAVHDTLQAPSLPLGVASIVRLIFGVPRWIQIAGAVLALIFGFVILVLLWRNRIRIVAWLRTRRRGLQYTMVGSVVAVLVLATFTGAKTWNYMQHDNGFCTGCHVMEKPFGRFAEFSGKHEKR